MRIEWQIAPRSEWAADALVFFVFEKPHEYLPGLRKFLSNSGKWLDLSAALVDFTGKSCEVAVAYAPAGEGGVRRVILAGLGPAEQFETERLKNAAAFVLRKCRDSGIQRPGIPIDALEGFACESSSCSIEELLRETLAGAMAGLHRFNELKTKNADAGQSPESIVLLCGDDPGPALRQAAALAEAEVAGILLARDLTISPANRATPGFIADTASEIAERFGFKITIIDLDSAQSLGMGAFAAVARGSTEPSFVIVIEHAPPGTEDDPPIVFIGKGITFDTGGISLKPRDKLEEMKQDMAGAASVLGAFEAIGRTGLGKRVVGILPCAENMPGGRAYKPGDVFRTYSGQTVEIISTDAEGRLVLCDALAYAADRLKPALMVDIATLTGACIMALGREVAAILGNREDLVGSIRTIGLSVGERFWPLPLWDFYFDALKSDVADMKNVGDRSAGTIVGAMFLKQFVPQKVPWVHLDIAGTAWTDKDTGFSPKGPTGFGVRTLFEIARRWPQL
ncbi:putative cytosol aminopeptidase [Syntrophobacter sp. SbD1]|nr:putative cytosol aminopeptidase [Syntrophobacter sp. SbD1]